MIFNDDRRYRLLREAYEKIDTLLVETHELKDIPYMEMIPKPISYEWACPNCHEIMREKDYSFKYHMELNAYTHSCCNKPFRAPKSSLNESYGMESSKSGFEDEGVGEVSKVDMDKIDAIVNDKDLPEVSEDGWCYEVLWAGCRGVFGCRRKSYLKDWVKEQGEWAEIVSIKYKKNDKKLKVIK
jgi:hypothetical protein